MTEAQIRELSWIVHLGGCSIILDKKAASYRNLIEKEVIAESVEKKTKEPRIRKTLIDPSKKRNAKRDKILELFDSGKKEFDIPAIVDCSPCYTYNVLVNNRRIERRRQGTKLIKSRGRPKLNKKFKMQDMFESGQSIEQIATGLSVRKSYVVESLVTKGLLKRGLPGKRRKSDKYNGVLNGKLK